MGLPRPAVQRYGNREQILLHSRIKCRQKKGGSGLLSGFLFGYRSSSSHFYNNLKIQLNHVHKLHCHNWHGVPYRLLFQGLRLLFHLQSERQVLHRCILKFVSESSYFSPALLKFGDLFVKIVPFRVGYVNRVCGFCYDVRVAFSKNLASAGREEASEVTEIVI